MVAVIKTGHSIHRIFNYNENKVKEGLAECIGAGNYPIGSDILSLSIKLNRFLKQLELNENVKRNSTQISLDFHPSETQLSKEKLLAINEIYMDKIGFGKQPYLVYQHHDAGLFCHFFYVFSWRHIEVFLKAVGEVLMGIKPYHICDLRNI
jgi:hypothetical protein